MKLYSNSIALEGELFRILKRIKEIKGLSQMILDQRSDIEEFLIEALENLKSSDPEGKYQINKKYDFSQLESNNQEQVLRLVFAKMNSGMSPVPWREIGTTGIGEEEPPSQMLKDSMTNEIDQGKIQ